MITGLRSRRSAAHEACGNGFGQAKRPSSIVTAELVNFAHHQVAILKQTIYALEQTYGFLDSRSARIQLSGNCKSTSHDAEVTISVLD
jgi:hypothetical protein